MSNGPKPFSSAWLTAPETPPGPPTRLNRHTTERIVHALSWLPGERALGVLAVIILMMASFWLATPSASRSVNHPAEETPEANLVFGTGGDAGKGDGQDPDISTDNLAISEGDRNNLGDNPTEAPSLSLNLPNQDAPDDGSLLPKYRLLLFYGFPGEATMGILGEYDMQRVLELLRKQAKEYEAADPSRPVKIGFEVIASVAQPEPQTDGSYLLDAPSELLDSYAEFAKANDMLLFLDVQFGRRTAQVEIEGLKRWLDQPHVHLALDPEFKMGEGHIPRETIGSIDAKDVSWAQQYLAELASAQGIPPKVLVVHQFKFSMIQNKDKVAIVPGVQLVIDMDGWGPPDLKRSTYADVITNQVIQFNGIKLFFKQDEPIMTAEDILKLSPAPDVIIYQ